ncbi:hypothetical protein GTY48_14020 [Bacillus thuringiensis]|uniref:YIP1 family protein n=1 Tax=Bacillus thuringiensis TaxID=1428 RepID=UPI001369F7A3|nr:YIP1 family protein [Bacillus thuringiensis]MYW24750.1 hypothetical protein [Bacillus thuringiensis]MYW24764.1 hypothetical protein [Bacillus thuringiensis]
MNMINTLFKEKEIKFFIPFVIYLLGLGIYLVAVLPFIETLMTQKIPSDVLNKFGHLDYIISLASFFLILLGLFFEAFVLFIVANVLGAQVKYRDFLKLFMFANIPMALRYLALGFKNVFFEPSMYLFFSQNGFLFKVIDLFNISYMILLYLLVKNKTQLNNTMKIIIFMFIVFLYRMVF